MGDKVRKSLLGLSGRNRRFMDSLVTLIWCECKEGNYTKSTSWEDCSGPLKMSHCGHLIENSDTEESRIMVKSIYDE